MLRRFTRPLFTIYDGKTDLVEHVSHYIQMMSLFSQNDGLMCNFGELMQMFRARFITCSKVPQLFNALLSMRIRSGVPSDLT